MIVFWYFHITKLVWSYFCLMLSLQMVCQNRIYSAFVFFMAVFATAYGKYLIYFESLNYIHFLSFSLWKNERNLSCFFLCYILVLFMLLECFYFTYFYFFSTAEKCSDPEVKSTVYSTKEGTMSSLTTMIVEFELQCKNNLKVSYRPFSLVL